MPLWKRKIGSLTAQDYADQLHQLEQREKIRADKSPTGAHITHQEKDAHTLDFKKKKRSLKNKMSALKSREKKRARYDCLQQEAKILRQHIDVLRQENEVLQRAYRNGLIAEQKHRYRQRRTICPVSPPTKNIVSKNNSFPMPSAPSSASLASGFLYRQRRTICHVSPPTKNIVSKNNSFPMPSAPSSASLASAFFDAQKNSTLVKPCTRNCRPAISTARNIQALNVAALDFDAQNNSTGVKPMTALNFDAQNNSGNNSTGVKPCTHNYRSAVSTARSIQSATTGVKPCTHNYRSAVSTARSIQSTNALHSAQYSHTFQGIPWQSFRSIFLALLNCTKNFVAAKTSKEILAQQITYSQSKRFLKRLFWKTLVSTGYESNFVGVRGITPQQRACAMFDDICDNIYEAILERAGMM